MTDSIFKGLMRDPRDVQAPPGSTNEALLALPQMREHTHDMQGVILYLPRTGLVVVPSHMNKGGSWACVVVFGEFGPRREDGRETYPRGGHHIDVSDLEMQTAIALEARSQIAVRISTKSGSEYEFPVSDLASAKELVEVNSKQGSTGKIVQTISFEPDDEWELVE